MMKSERKDGGPAFPSEQGHTPDGTWNQTYEQGMSLRDAFALAVAPALVEQFELIKTLDPSSRYHERDMEMFAKGAYRIADALLKARSDSLLSPSETEDTP